MKTTKYKEAVIQMAMEAYELSPEIRAAIAAAEKLLGRRKAFGDALDRNFEEEATAVREYEAGKSDQADAEAEMAICLTSEDAMKKEQVALQAKNLTDERRETAERYARLRAAIESKCREIDEEIAVANDALSREISAFTAALMEPLASDLRKALDPLIQVFMVVNAASRATRGFLPASLYEDFHVPNPTNYLAPLLSYGFFTKTDGTRVNVATDWMDDPVAKEVFEKLRVVADTARKMTAHARYVPLTSKQRQDAALARSSPAVPEPEPLAPASSATNATLKKGSARANRRDPSIFQPQELNIGAVLMGDIE